MKNKTTELVNSLKAHGFRVKASHSRVYREYTPTRINLVTVPNVEVVTLAKDGLRHALPKGGETVVEITTPGGVKYFGSARCSLSDSFNKHTGYATALRRALKDLMKDLKVVDHDKYCDVLALVQESLA
jgi:hypothetical protein